MLRRDGERQLTDQKDPVGGIQSREGPLAQVMFAISYGDREVGAQQIENRPDRRGVEQLVDLWTVARRQSPHAAGTWRQQRVQQLTVHLVALRDQMPEVVCRLQVEKDTDITTGHNQIGERDPRIRACQRHCLSQVYRDARAAEAAFAAVDGDQLALLGLASRCGA